MPSVERMKKIAQDALDAFSAGDWKRYKSYLTDEAIYEEEATGRRAQGGDAAVQAIETWKRAFPDLAGTIKEAIGSGDALVIELEWAGTHSGPLVGPFGTLPPTKKLGKTRAVQVARFDGEKIREIHHYFDMRTLLRQIGVAPEMGAAASTRP